LQHRYVEIRQTKAGLFSHLNWLALSCYKNTLSVTILFQQLSALAMWECTAVQLLQCKTFHLSWT